MKKIIEVRNDFVDDENLCHIDGWHDDDSDSEGKTVAVVDLDTLKVIWFDNRERGNEMVLAAINEVKARPRQTIAIIWSVEDVAMKAHERGMAITNEEASEILSGIARRHDASIGVNWDVIDVWLDDYDVKLK